MSALENLSTRIEAMDWRKPYVWRLKISASEFAALEAAVAAGGTTARQNIVYLAEWYKRCYDGGAAKPVRTFDAKALFEAAGTIPPMPSGTGSALRSCAANTGTSTGR